MFKFIILPLLLVNMLLALDIGNRDNFEFSKPEHDIYFVNGMGNIEEEAYENLKELRIFLASKQLHKAESWENFDYKKNLKLAYNFKEEPLVELYEAYKQASDDNDNTLNWEDFLKQLNGVVDIHLDLKKSKAGKIKKSILAVAEMYADYLVGFSDVNQDPDLLEHIEQYRLSLLSGKKVVLVAHSQGNFYANLAYEELHKMYADYPNSGENLSEAISIVGVASVSSKLRADKDYKYYTTFHDDKVWQKVKGLYDTTLDSNELASICPDEDSAYKVSEYAVDLSCHSFSGTYLNENNTARDAIYNYIILSSSRLAKNPKLKLEVDKKKELLNCDKKYQYGFSNVDIENALGDYSYYFNYNNVYPFNLNEKKLYKVAHQDGTENYVSASNGGDLIQHTWLEQKDNECYRLHGTGEIISEEANATMKYDKVQLIFFKRWENWRDWNSKMNFVTMLLVGYKDRDTYIISRQASILSPAVENGRWGYRYYGGNIKVPGQNKGGIVFEVNNLVDLKMLVDTDIRIKSARFYFTQEIFESILEE